MSSQTKTIAEINAKLRRGDAVVMTASEFKKEVRNGYKFKVSDVDVVTTATRAIMSGTSAMLVIPVAAAGAFARAQRMWLNGVPCFPGSHPAEGTGKVDTVIFGTEESVDYPGRYGGGHLLRDIVEGREIEVECLTTDDRTILTSFTIEDLDFARLYNFRNDYQNYTAFANVNDHPSYRQNPKSIFACRPMPRLKGMTASGSGELNPLENDRRAKVLKAGMKILVNKVPGTLIGYGTRSTPGMRAISLAADMFGMDPEFMGGFKTSFGVEVTNGIAVPFPITDAEVIADLSWCLDENIALKIADIGDRIPLVNATYADLWQGAPLEVEFLAERCIHCAFQCPAEYYCPMGAISWRQKEIDQSLCVACGACTANCLGGAFTGKGQVPQGSIGDIPAFGRRIPVLFRQSNRRRAQILTEYLKELMDEGAFLLNDSSLEMKHWNL
ncbi:MAG TPA: methanogenesis marker 16 metalloprotein [Alphaproteobacteria bacterium]|jgi:putative methanogenesis marker 16 metalloprotein|nr:methanogenesis marker 16 metalloprotein [Alphaproteobacteria bacterium]HJM51353.1 methanogenesis marker 16 metalloprotein [Alphaproteobacteria bacterium]